MTRQLDSAELRLRLIVARERQLISGRYSRQAMAEKNVAIPAIEARFWAQYQVTGELPELNDFFPVDAG